MYQEMKDLHSRLERQHNAAAEGANVSQGERNAFYRGQMNAFWLVMGFVADYLDEYENGEQPTPAEIATSDFADYVSFMRQCQP